MDIWRGSPGFLPGIFQGLCTNAVETAENDRERAEAGYYCGVILTEFNRPAESLFILLKNTVFYHMHDSWEAKSLVASLRNYALLNDRERIESTCNILVEKFPDTSYSRCAMRWQEKCKTEMSPKEILAVIQLPLEK